MPQQTTTGRFLVLLRGLEPHVVTRFGEMGGSRKKQSTQEQELNSAYQENDLFVTSLFIWIHTFQIIN